MITPRKATQIANWIEEELLEEAEIIGPNEALSVEPPRTESPFQKSMHSVIAALFRAAEAK